MSAAHVGFSLSWAESLHHSVSEHDCGNNMSCSSFHIYSNPFHPFPANGGGPSALGGQFFHKIIFMRNNCVERCLCLALNIYSTYAWDTQYSDFAYFHLSQILERVCLPYL